MAANEADRGVSRQRWTMLRVSALLLRITAALTVLWTAWRVFDLSDRLTGSQLAALAVLPLAYAFGQLVTAEVLLWMVHVAVHTRGNHVALRELLVELRKPEPATADSDSDTDYFENLQSP